MSHAITYPGINNQFFEDGQILCWFEQRTLDQWIMCKLLYCFTLTCPVCFYRRYCVAAVLTDLLAMSNTKKNLSVSSEIVHSMIKMTFYCDCVNYS